MSADLFGTPERPHPTEPRIFSVTELTRAVRGCIEEKFGEVWVQGEISNHRQQPSGHQYFTLKDADCQLPCVMFARPGAWRRAAALENGMLVQAKGKLTVYEARGQYQLNVSLVQPAGAGMLQAKFEALKRKLDAEGLFAPDRKRALPKFPRALGIVTSPSGAALRDMLHVLARRAPWLRVIISPARVQGDGAAAEIIAAMRELCRVAAPVDVIVLARGGGSIEDLWEFNDEALARAIVASPIPVVSAVGHEIDFTIADFVADHRAPTPSAAAEIIAPDSGELLGRLDQRGAFLRRHTLAALESARAQLAALARSALFREPRQRVEQSAQRLDAAEQALARAMQSWVNLRRQGLAAAIAELRQHRPDQQLALLRQRLAALASRATDRVARQIQLRREHVAHAEASLRLLSPRHTLERGYTLTTMADGQLVRSASAVADGAELVTEFHDGKVISVARRKPRRSARREAPAL